MKKFLIAASIATLEFLNTSCAQPVSTVIIEPTENRANTKDPIIAAPHKPEDSMAPGCKARINKFQGFVNYHCKDVLNELCLGPKMQAKIDAFNEASVEEYVECKKEMYAQIPPPDIDEIMEACIQKILKNHPEWAEIPACKEKIDACTYYTKKREDAKKECSGNE